ncbi:MAG: cytochrome C [Rhodobacteraceae bacterium]|nr:MAG: cytochrome C [Paracoccaceae bacterium]
MHKSKNARDMKRTRPMRLKSTTFVSVLAVTALAACNAVGPLDTAESGAVLFRQNCVICHGVSGAGDGPEADALPVAPANLRALAAANDGVFPAEAVMATIYGYRGKDYAGLMPEFGPVLDSPSVIWIASDGREIPTPSALVALTGYLETIQDP